MISPDYQPALRVIIKLMPSKNFEEFAEFCRNLPASTEVYQWDCFVWKVGGKIFAIANPESDLVSVKTTPERKPILEQDPLITHAPYLGNKGWVQIDFASEEMLPVAMDLTEESHKIIASKLSQKRQAELFGNQT